MTTIYLSLGSNLGAREQYLQRAIELLATSDLSVGRVSSIYETAPRERVNQPWFLNLVLEARTRLFPIQLLAHVRKIERQLGRKRVIDKGPRTIDIDILFYGSVIIDTKDLQIPHPRLAERRFVLEPLAEIAPELRHPRSRKTVREMLDGTRGQAVQRHFSSPSL